MSLFSKPKPRQALRTRGAYSLGRRCHPQGKAGESHEETTARPSLRTRGEERAAAGRFSLWGPLPTRSLRLGRQRPRQVLDAPDLAPPETGLERDAAAVGTQT